jgi:hypothetical protein
VGHETVITWKVAGVARMRFVGSGKDSQHRVRVADIED